MAQIRIVKWHDANTVCWEGEATDMRAALQQALASRADLTGAGSHGRRSQERRSHADS